MENSAQAEFHSASAVIHSATAVIHHSSFFIYTAGASPRPTGAAQPIARLKPFIVGGFPPLRRDKSRQPPNPLSPPGKIRYFSGAHGESEKPRWITGGRRGYRGSPKMSNANFWGFTDMGAEEGGRGAPVTNGQQEATSVDGPSIPTRSQNSSLRFAHHHSSFAAGNYHLSLCNSK